MKPRVLWSLWVVSCLMGAWQAAAIPLNTRLFCTSYSSSPLCRNGTTVCQTCHTAPPEANLYGRELAGLLLAYPDYDRTPASFQKYLSQALDDAGPLDSDGDGFSNQEEILAGSNASDASSQPVQDPEPDTDYDPELAWRRIHLLFCGTTPGYQAFKAFQSMSQIKQKGELHRQLDRCLRSDFWRYQALPRLADEKIRPNKAIGVEGDPFIIGDYNYDYRLFVYIMSGDRDMRDLLLARYHINAAGDKVESPIPDAPIPGRITVANGQPLQVDRRYGMITTQWFIATNTMFATLPRNTASQAYRAYLGLDIARSEGLYPVSDEPRDVDSKGVKVEACAVCHSTLDPLAYAFTPYVGLAGARQPVGTYTPQRNEWESWTHLFGEPVADLGEWARKAAASDAFKKQMTRTLFRYALGREPRGPQEQKDFDALWQKLPALSYQAEDLVHEIVDTLSFAGRN
jgi:hypothetical protein